MYPRFHLVLMITHACNLRCSYCYTGEKSSRTMTEDVGRKAIDRAIASLEPGGVLELGFFGGEPLLEPELITTFIEYARGKVGNERNVQLGMTTNGTLALGKAWELLTLPELDLAISHDGLPEIHDKHRKRVDGGESAAIVEQTIRDLVAAQRDVRVVMVVRPDTIGSLPEGVNYLRDLGIRRFDLSLDLWAKWEREHVAQLDNTVARLAQLWRSSLPQFEITWFDEKAARFAGCELQTARCSFGDGQIAVAPSGNLYPCERLIGNDIDSNPMRLAGHAMQGDDFLDVAKAEERCAPECSVCELQAFCGTTCRCSNYVRTGRVERPDGLLCLVEQLSIRETAKVLGFRQELVDISD